MPNAALFDMDKTLIRVNSARLFTRYRRERGEVSALEMARVSWWLLRYWLGNLDANSIATRALVDYRGFKESDMIAMCDEWFSSQVKKHITPAARQAVQRHREQGDVLIIASTATSYITRPLSQELGMDEVVCTELLVEDGRLTGEVESPICYGKGKLERVTKRLDHLGLSLRDATFYSDSITDLPLMEAVGTAVAVNPDLRLRSEARRRGWRLELWQ
jgi:HAD superfamily hydrolase (TIGR01490 family)